MVSAPISRALSDLGYVTPTPIQDLAVPRMLSGIDMVGQAQTGTGKTAAFGIPIAEAVDGRSNDVQAIVLVPTRELAQQVANEIAQIAKHRGINVTAIYGGQPIKRQLDALERGVHVVIGTPGRVIDHLDRRTLDLGRVRIAVLDEADQMLDIGFFPDIRRILQHTPRSRQTVLFTATAPTQIRRLIYSYLNEPEWIQVGQVEEPVDEVQQLFCEVAERDKQAAMMELLRTKEYDQALIFRRTQIGVDKLVSFLVRRGFAIDGIHGSLPQGKRDSVMRAFRQGTLKLLVATNLASRGLDIPAVSTVISYDMPDNVEEYLHRIGRTARMGRPGTAVTFVGEWDFDAFETIKRQVGEDNLEKLELSIYDKYLA
ncbi:MAG: DEAD/DEAH box helicase [Chloroflexi bacterium]|nr:DEAD/DEAH box helicase [Chloroflexota bacterium]